MRGEMRVLVRADGSLRQIAALEGSRLMEYTEQTGDSGSQVGAVLLGRVERVLPPVGAAFVNLGQPLNGFLPLKEMESFEKSGHIAPLVTGREALVQVKKDAKDGKGAFLTRDIGLPGLYSVWMPLNRHVGVSGRVKDESDRTRLVALGRKLTGGKAGVIMRHAALEARPEELQEEISAHRALWEEIVHKAEFARPPAVLYKEASELNALLRDHAARYSLAVFAASEDCRQEIPADSAAFHLQSQAEMDALWQGARVGRQVEEALGRHVALKGGGTLVIDEREAMTTIDVNTAKFVGESGEDELSLRQNLEACEEIARQIRLRNLGGILLIDFIDMHTDEARGQVRQMLEQFLALDRVKTVVHGFTSLGILEMTRKRTRESLRGALTEPCPCCGENGRKACKRKGAPT